MKIVLIKQTVRGIKRREVVVKEIYKISKEGNLTRTPVPIDSKEAKVIKTVDQSTGDYYILFDKEATISKAISKGQTDLLNVDLKVIRNWIHKYKTIKVIQILKS